MKQLKVPSRRTSTPEIHSNRERVSFPLLSLRVRSILFGIAAAIILTLLIALGSRGFHWFDAALIGYAVATIFAVAAVTYKYTFWIARPPTWRYWWRSWQLFLSYENFRHYIDSKSNW